MTKIPRGIQTFSHAFADQGCYIFMMCSIALDDIISSMKDLFDLRFFYHAMDPLGSAVTGIQKGWVSNDKLMKVLNYSKFMEYLTQEPVKETNSKPNRWNFRKESPGYSASPNEYLIGRYSGILKVNPIKHYVRMRSDGKTIHLDSMVNSPITKKGKLTSIHVFWRSHE